MSDDMPTDLQRIEAKLDALSDRLNSFTQAATERTAILETKATENKKELDAMHETQRACALERQKEGLKQAEQRGRFMLWDMIWRGVLTAVTGYVFYRASK